MSKNKKPTASDAVDELSAPCRHVQCALCRRAPCDCPEFGTPAYFELIDRRHGRSS